MSDIFISYSSKDREKAEQLTELLTSAGLSVWIDHSGIDVATSWSEGIVEAIDACRAFVVMLSSSSIASHNVIKEVSLASEKRKKILPLDLEPVEIPKSMQYALAGIQRSPMTNIDAVIRALGKIGLDATSVPSIKLVKETDGRKSLMVLPFEDLSPTGDNQWFADGIVSELVTALSNVKALRVTDQQTTKEFKTYNGHLTTYAREMSVRYFVQGDVRKFGDNIKITARLLDIETGDHLWHDSLKGTMQDIFDIQEQVAIKVVNGLNIILTKEEKLKLDERGTENPEAYEYFMRARELFDLNTREGFVQAIALLDLTIELDPLFVDVLIYKAFSMVMLYRYYERNEAVLRAAEATLHRAEELNPGGWRVHDLLANLYLVEGRTEDAEREHQEHIARDDGSALSHCQLGYFCFHTKQYAKAFKYYETSIDSNNLTDLWNVIINARKSGSNEGVDRWAGLAISALQKQIRLHPEDVNARLNLAAIYFWSDPSRRTESLHELHILESMPDLDSDIQYRIASLLAEQREDDHAIQALRKAIDKGFANFGRIRDTDSPFAPILEHPEFMAVMKLSKQ